MKSLSMAGSIKIHGDYDDDPVFLIEPLQKPWIGTAELIIPTHVGAGAAVARLGFPITCEGITGDIMVLILCLEGQTLETKGPIHLELCGTVTDDKQCSERKQGVWMESRAATAIPYYA